jgi:long-subunit acyl-CoA synthetase (AMP-forming)
LVGGAPINAALASLLSGTRLRVGYGQTEAGPGIMLGEPGQFRPGILGRPVGCEVRIEPDGVLAFHGPNACTGYWEGGRLHSLEVDRWQRTDDLVALDAGTYVFVGRASQTFKISNGRVVDAPRLEAAIRAAIPRIVDVVLTGHDSGAILALYSTADALPVDAQQMRTAIGSLGGWLAHADCVGTDAWVRTPKGEIDRRNLPATR